MRTAAALVVLILTMGILWFNNRPLVPIEATWPDVVREAEAGGYRLIEIEELQKRYQSSSTDLLLVDTRQEWEYRTGHIKGAVNFPMELTWWSRWSKKSELKEFLGPDKSKSLVFY